MFDRVQDHVDDVAKAEDSCPDLEEEAAGMPAKNGNMSSWNPYLPDVKP